MKKRILSAILALAFILSSVSVLAFATEDSQIPATMETVGVDPTASCDSSDVNASFSVNIAWDSMNFKYNFGDKWDPKTHTYVSSDGSDLGWNKTSASVTVTNHSNCAVSAQVGFVKTTENDALKNVDASYDKNAAVLESAVGSQDGVSEIFTLSVSGAPTSAIGMTAFGMTEITISGSQTLAYVDTVGTVPTRQMKYVSSTTGNIMRLINGETVAETISEKELAIYRAVAEQYIEDYGYAKVVGGIKADQDGTLSIACSDLSGVVDIEFFDWNRNGSVEMMILYSEEASPYFEPQYVAIYAIQNGVAKLILKEEPGLEFGMTSNNTLDFTMVNNRLDLIVHHSTPTVLNETAYAYVNGKTIATNLYGEVADGGFTNTKVNGEVVTFEEFMEVYDRYAQVEWETMMLNSDPVNAEYAMAFLRGELNVYSIDRSYPCWEASNASEHTDWFYYCRAFITDLTVSEYDHQYDSETGCCQICGTECDHTFWYENGERCAICGKINPDYVLEEREHDIEFIDGEYICNSCGHHFGTECPHDTNYQNGGVCSVCGASNEQ